MKIIKKDLKKQELTLKIENLDDIWTLNQIVEVGDTIKGKTERKIKIGSSDDRNIKVVRKHVFLSIKVEKAEISTDSKILKVLGIITGGPDDVPRGEHHSFNLEANSVFTIIKNKWLNFQIEKIVEASKAAPLKILMTVFDREEAYFAKLKGQGYEMLGKIIGDVQKKEEKHVSKDNFYKEISKKIEEYEKSGDINNIILGSPGFWKENLMKVLPDEIKKKSVLATVSYVSERAMSELLKRDELQKVLEKNMGSQEIKLMDKLLQNISKDTACYGFKETKEKVEAGAVSELLVSYSFLQQAKEKNNYEELEKLMIACEQMDGKIHIISSEEAKKSLDSLSGIAGILRWKA
ncbi:mRNA surveillance protein pelota [Candidatus Woesearchaeota archaeon]|nr:mRNA surveillance protein pelota [Candidatus Woesearchaeota archaeon]